MLETRSLDGTPVRTAVVLPVARSRKLTVQSFGGEGARFQTSSSKT